MKHLIPVSSIACLLTHATSAAVLTNGDFEQNTIGANIQNFTGWGEFQTDSNATVRNTAAIIATTTISGTASAELVAGGTNGGAIRQAISPALTQFSTTLNFASLTPEAGAAADTRYFSMQLKHGGGLSIDQINIRIIKSGQLQSFNGTWQNVGTLTALFSTDTGTAGAWGTETVVSNSLGIVGNYTTTPSYSISLNGTTVNNLSFFQGTAPTAGSDLDTISFNGNLSAKNFLVDNVVVVPEPSAALLVALTSSLAVLRRRRSR